MITAHKHLKTKTANIKMKIVMKGDEIISDKVQYQTPLFKDHLDTLPDAKIFTVKYLKNGLSHAGVDKQRRKYTFVTSSIRFFKYLFKFTSCFPKI